MRLDRQIHTAGLENREHRGQPVEVPLGHHADDRFARDAARHQGSGNLIGTTIELAVGELVRAVHGGDGVRTVLGLDLEQLVGPAVGQRATRSGGHMTSRGKGAACCASTWATPVLTRMGCRCQYVSDLHSHSIGPNWNALSHHTLNGIWMRKMVTVRSRPSDGLTLPKRARP